MPPFRDPIYAPLDGTVNIPETIEFNWKHNADYPAFVYNQDGTDNVTEITHLEFGRACHRVAHALRPNFDLTTRPTIGLIALTDVLLYQATVIGIMRANLVVCLFSLYFRNIAEAKRSIAISHISTKHSSCSCPSSHENFCSSSDCNS